MSPENSRTPREEMEAWLTSYLLGELSEGEAAAVRELMAHDAELKQLHDRLQQTIGLLRDAELKVEAPTEPLKLSEERRQRLLASFKIPPLKPSEVKPKRKFRMTLIEALVVVAIVAILTSLFLPALSKSKSRSQRVAVLSNMRQLEGAKEMWAKDNGRSAGDTPTMEDLKPYFKGELHSVGGETYVIGGVGEPVSTQTKNNFEKSLADSQRKLAEGKLADGRVQISGQVFDANAGLSAQDAKGVEAIIMSAPANTSSAYKVYTESFAGSADSKTPAFSQNSTSGLDTLKNGQPATPPLVQLQATDSPTLAFKTWDFESKAGADTTASGRRGTAWQSVYLGSAGDSQTQPPQAPPAQSQETLIMEVTRTLRDSDETTARVVLPSDSDADARGRTIDGFARNQGIGTWEGAMPAPVNQAANVPLEAQASDFLAQRGENFYQSGVSANFIGGGGGGGGGGGQSSPTTALFDSREMSEARRQIELAPRAGVDPSTGLPMAHPTAGEELAQLDRLERRSGGASDAKKSQPLSELPMLGTLFRSDRNQLVPVGQTDVAAKDVKQGTDLFGDGVLTHDFNGRLGVVANGATTYDRTEMQRLLEQAATDPTAKSEDSLNLNYANVPADKAGKFETGKPALRKPEMAGFRLLGPTAGGDAFASDDVSGHSTTNTLNWGANEFGLEGGKPVAGTELAGVSASNRGLTTDNWFGANVGFVPQGQSESGGTVPGKPLATLDTGAGEFGRFKSDVVAPGQRAASELSLAAKSESEVLRGTIPSVIGETPQIPNEKIEAATHVRNGQIYLEMGKLDDAERELLNAQKLDPNDRGAGYFLNLTKDARFKEAERRREYASREQLVEAEKEWTPPQKRAARTIPNGTVIHQKQGQVDAAALPQGKEAAAVPYGYQSLGVPRANVAGDSVATVGGGIRGVTRTNSMEAISESFRKYMSARGVDLSPTNGKSVFYNDRSGELLVRATPQELDIIADTIDGFSTRSTNAVASDKREVENLSLKEALSRYAELEGRSLVVSPTVASDGGTVQLGKNLTKEQQRRELDRALGTNQISMIPIGEKAIKAVALAEAGYAGADRTGRQDVINKLNSIRLPASGFEGLPLDAVVQYVNEEARKHDPSSKGINFLLNPTPPSGAAVASPVVEPTTGLPVAAAPVEGVDIGTVPILMTNKQGEVSLREMLDAITRSAGHRIKYSIENWGVEFSLADVEEVPMLRAPSTNAPIPQPEIQTSENNFSTFSLNVSDVSFKLAAASLEKGQMPDMASIRSEEFINAFDYRDPEAAAGAPIAFAWERSRYPFAQNRDLLRFSLKTAAEGRQAGRPMNIVLLLDNSGSMERADRVQIIREALRVLASQLQPQDKLSVITFARTPQLVADGIAGDKASEVTERVSGLTPQGGTNLEEAMNLAYQTAARHFVEKGMNRVVLLTDGAANLGDVHPESLKQKVEGHRKQGIALDCFGIGWEGFNDDLLEVLSRNGDGRYGFINSAEEAATEFAGQLAGALKVAASDVKVQVEFNPRRVTTYRQIGYAKHQLTKEQFRDNTVDAAEIAAQEAGNALYTVEVNPAGQGPLCTVRARYKIPGTTEYRELAWDVPYAGAAISLEQSTAPMRLAASASAFAEWLVASPFAGDVSPDRVLGYLRGVPEVYGADTRPKKLEWMLRLAKSLEGK